VCNAQSADLLEQRTVLVLHEGEGATGGARARGPPDAVQIVLQRARRIIVDYVLHAQDVQATRRDIRRQQERHIPLHVRFRGSNSLKSGRCD